MGSPIMGVRSFLCIFVFGMKIPRFCIFPFEFRYSEIVEMGVPLTQEADLPDRIQKSVEKKPETEESTTASAKEIISAPVIPRNRKFLLPVQLVTKPSKPSEFSQTSQQETMAFGNGVQPSLLPLVNPNQEKTRNTDFSLIG